MSFIPETRANDKNINEGAIRIVEDVADILKQMMASELLASMKDVDETYWAQTHEALDIVLYEAIREIEVRKND